jgi:hypothetical protein
MTTKENTNTNTSTIGNSIDRGFNIFLGYTLMQLTHGVDKVNIKGVAIPLAAGVATCIIMDGSKIVINNYLRPKGIGLFNDYIKPRAVGLYHRILRRQEPISLLRALQP